MNKLLLFTLLLTSTSGSLFSQCSEEQESAVLLIGDSWAFFMNTDGTLNNVLNHWGHSNKKFNSSPTLSVNGARAEDFLVDTKLNEIEAQLNDNPSIEVVHLSLGGNDFLGNWNVTYSAEETEELSNETYDELMTLINFIKGVRPSIRIVYSGYMYANFAEVIDDAAPFEESHPFYATWEGMGFPSFLELNTLLNDFSERVYDMSLTDPLIDFIHVPALMQHIYGQEDPLGVDPGGTYAPLYQPLPFGDLTYPSPKVAMRDYGLVRDCFHLSVEAYFFMIDYQFQKFYHKFFMDDAYFLADFDTRNGSVNSEGETSTDLLIGEDDLSISKLVLSFNTSSMADTTIESASIFLRRELLSGGSPIGETLTIKMINGNFGSSVNIEGEDFSDEGDISGEACVYGTNEDNSDWIRLELPTSFLSLISNDGTMQFLISAEGAFEEEIIYSNGSDPEFAPVFNIQYKSGFANLTDTKINSNDFILFPNPASEQLNIFSKNGNFNQVKLLNLQGQVILEINQNVNKIDISNLESGNYFLQFTSEYGVSVQQFIKQ